MLVGFPTVGRFFPICTELSRGGFVFSDEGIPASHPARPRFTRKQEVLYAESE
jgi:hypothetical protein